MKKPCSISCTFEDRIFLPSCTQIDACHPKSITGHLFFEKRDALLSISSDMHQSVFAVHPSRHALSTICFAVSGTQYRKSKDHKD